MFSKFSNWLSDSFINWLTKDRPVEGAPLCDFERICYEVRPCDVLLIEGRSKVSDIIRSITQSSWSHAALYIGRIHDIEDPKIRNLLSAHFHGSPDTQLIIEGMMGQGTIVSKLSSYEKDHIRLCRPRGLSRKDAQHVISFAVHKIGTEYDVRQALDLARFLLPWSIMPRKFRSQLFEHHMGESVKTVCSSMIAEAFASVEFPILPLVKHNAEQGIELITRNPKLYSPRDFDYSPYFDIIKYPFVEFADYAMYRKLPWNREGLVSHDKVGIKSSGPRLSESLPPKKKKKKNSALKRFRDRFGSHSIDPLDLSDSDNGNGSTHNSDDPTPYDPTSLDPKSFEDRSEDPVVSSSIKEEKPSDEKKTKSKKNGMSETEEL